MQVLLLPLMLCQIWRETVGSCSECSVTCGLGLAMKLTEKIFQLERPLLFWVLQINDARNKEGRKGAFPWIFASALSSVRTRTFFHESQVLDVLGLVVALELGTITLPGFVGVHSSGRRTGEQKSLNWGADFIMSHAAAGMTGM